MYTYSHTNDYFTMLHTTHIPILMTTLQCYIRFCDVDTPLHACLYIKRYKKTSFFSIVLYINDRYSTNHRKIRHRHRHSYHITVAYTMTDAIAINKAHATEKPAKPSTVYNTLPEHLYLGWYRISLRQPWSCYTRDTQLLGRISGIACNTGLPVVQQFYNQAELNNMEKKQNKENEQKVHWSKECLLCT